MLYRTSGQLISADEKLFPVAAGGHNYVANEEE